MVLEVKDLHVFYGHFEALNGLSFRVEENEVVALAGPNGHGKSTTLHSILGLTDIRRGTILFQGKHIENELPVNIVKMGVILVPEGGNLFPEMTVLENLLMGAYHPNAWKKRHDNLTRVFELFPMLEKIKDRLCMRLSGGERRAVAIGRGLMSSAKLLMLDEPTLGLAPVLVKNISEKIKEIKDTGMTIILVEENIRYVSELSDRIYLVNKGKIALEGKADKVLKDSVFREAYLGLK